MACGDRYRHLIVTVSGLNPDNPYDDVATSSDYEEWVDLARSMLNTSQTFMDALGKAEAPAVTRWNEVNELKSKAIADYDALPSSWLAFNTSQAIQSAESVCFQAACVLERAEDAMAELGKASDVPSVPGGTKPRDNPSKTAAVGNTLLLIGGVALGGYVLVRVAKKRRRA